jgi:hypothetical protein
MEDHMVDTKTSNEVVKGKTLSTSKIEKLLVEAINEKAMYPTDTPVDPSTLTSMAKIIKNMGLSAPIKMDLPPSLTGVNSSAAAVVRVPKLTNTEMLMLTLMASPEEWHIAAKSKSRRANVGLGGFGSCFELRTRNENGMISHYVRYTDSGKMSPQGHSRYAALQQKLKKIEDAVRSGSPVFSNSKKVSVSQSSLSHAGKYAINAQELKFLEVVSRPNTRMLATEGTSKSSYWQTFRWKWQNYGFDLSQLVIEQEKQPNGTFNIYVTCSGLPNQGIRSLVEFLANKPGARA